MHETKDKLSDNIKKYKANSKKTKDEKTENDLASVEKEDLSENDED